jgi:hypothetical protein
MTVSTNATQLSQFESASRMAALNGGARPTSPVTQPPPTVTVPAAGEAAAEQAAAGAAQTQQKPEAFNAPPLDLPDNPTTLDVMAGLTKAMADPSVNASTAQQLFSLHEQLMQAEKAMMQVIVDGMLI